MNRRDLKKIVIIGAGPAGIGAALRLEEKGAEWILLERQGYVGGLAASFCRHGFVFDIGGHVLFSQNHQFNRILARHVPEEQWLRYRRVSAIRLCRRWIPFPLQLHLDGLPAVERRRCQDGLTALAKNRVRPDQSDFASFIDTHFGRGIAELFMIPYNTKVWQFPLARMSADWVGERIALMGQGTGKHYPSSPGSPVAPGLRSQKHCFGGVSCPVRQLPDRGVLHFRQATEPDDWGPNRCFRYPLRGGMGFLWRRLAAALPARRIHLQSRVVGVDVRRRSVCLDHGPAIPYEALISTMPLDCLVRVAGVSRLQALARRLIHTRSHIIGLGIQGPVPESIRGYCWMYFPESRLPFYRATMLSHYSPYNAPPFHWSLLLEVSESTKHRMGGEALLSRCIAACRREGLIRRPAQIICTWSRRAEYGYPVPTVDRDEVLNQIIPELEAVRIFSCGRFGAWRYEAGNMDHAFMQGYAAADRILQDLAQ